MTLEGFAHCQWLRKTCLKINTKMVSQSVKKRQIGGSSVRFSAVPTAELEASEYDTLTSFKGKKYLGRSYSPTSIGRGSKAVLVLLCVALLATLSAGYYCYFHFHWFHYQIARSYAHLGYPHAQHIVGERLLHGSGVEQDQVLTISLIVKNA